MGRMYQLKYGMHLWDKRVPLCLTFASRDRCLDAESKEQCEVPWGPITATTPQQLSNASQGHSCSVSGCLTGMMHPPALLPPLYTQTARWQAAGHVTHTGPKGGQSMPVTPPPWDRFVWKAVTFLPFPGDFFFHHFVFSSWFFYRTTWLFKGSHSRNVFEMHTLKTHLQRKLPLDYNLLKFINDWPYFCLYFFTYSVYNVYNQVYTLYFLTTGISFICLIIII